MHFENNNGMGRNYAKEIESLPQDPWKVLLQESEATGDSIYELMAQRRA